MVTVPTDIDFPLDERLRELVSSLSQLFESRGATAYATGGFVRDVLRGSPAKDLDVSIDADPLSLAPEIADAFGGSFFVMDEDRRLVRVLLPREDVHLDLQPLRGSIQEDLWTRDYTIDAMAATLREAASGRIGLIDPKGGLADLRSRIVRAVGEANLLDDPLRMLRGARLATVLGFELDPATADMIRRSAAQVRTSAVERQRDEMMLIMGTDRAGAGLRLLDDLGLLADVLPEMDVMRGVDQPTEHHWDVFNHSIEAVAAMDLLLADDAVTRGHANAFRDELWQAMSWWEGARGYFWEVVVPGVQRTAVIKLGCLLHDIGKPATKSFQEDGRMRFFGHAAEGAELARKLMRRMHFSSRETKMVTEMIDAHMRPLQMAQQGPPSNRAIYRFFRDTGDAGIDTLFLSLADHMAAVGPRLRMDGWRRHLAIVSHILQRRMEEPAVISPTQLLRGDDLMAVLGVAPGPELGQVLELVREAQAAGEVTTREDALDLARRHLEQLGATR